MNSHEPTLATLKRLTKNSSRSEIALAAQMVMDHVPSDVTAATVLATALAQSGNRRESGDRESCDVASTGGPSSLSTLLCPLYLVAAGAEVPKLGVPGRPAGGIDCLAQIAGYRPELDIYEVNKILSKTRYAHFLASGDTAPLDGLMFSVRQQIGAQRVPTLVAASLLSKKLAVGVKYAGLDVRVSAAGNFGSDWQSATNCATLFIESAKLLGITAKPVLTAGTFAYQPFIGRTEALMGLEKIFNGKQCSWLDDHVRTCKTLAMACLPNHLRGRIRTTTGQELFDHFAANLEAQGSSAEQYRACISASLRSQKSELLAKNDGYCSYPLDEIRSLLVQWQQSRLDKVFPDPAGLELLHRPGTWVKAGEPVAVLRAADWLFSEAHTALSALLCTLADRPAELILEGI